MCSRNVKYLTIVAVGDQISNKTELLLKYTGNHKSDQYEDFLRPSFQNNFQEIVVDSNPYTVYFVDVESDDDFEILRKDNYERADCILLCYSLKFRQSFKNIYKKWCIEVRRSAPFTPLVLVGTDSEAKSCGEVKELVSTEEGDNLKLLIGAYAFIECSVTKFLGIDDIFIEAVRSTCRPRC